MTIQHIGVVGAGSMGTGIAHVAAQSGFQVTLHDVEMARVEKSIATMDALMQRAVQKGRLSEEERQATRSRLRPTESLGELGGADYVIEAVFEQMEVKRTVLGRLDAICRPEVILATNTSSFSITELAGSTGRAAQVVGMHFFNPAQVMRLVEVIRGYQTSDATVAVAMDLAARFGKTAIEVKKDSPGFVVNRVLMPFMAEAIKLVEEGIATPEDVDTAVKLGLNHPMGPFTLMDFTGVDVCHHVMEYFYQEFRQPQYAPPLSLRQLVRAGRLGKKVGKGFFDHE